MELEVEDANNLLDMGSAALEADESSLSLESEIVSEHNAEEGGYFGQ